MRNATASCDSGKVATKGYLRISLSFFFFLVLGFTGKVEGVSQDRKRALGIGYGSRGSTSSFSGDDAVPPFASNNSSVSNDDTDSPVASPDFADSISNDDTDQPSASPESVGSISNDDTDLDASASNDDTDTLIISEARTEPPVTKATKSAGTRKLTKSPEMKQSKTPVTRTLNSWKERKLGIGFNSSELDSSIDVRAEDEPIISEGMVEYRATSEPTVVKASKKSKSTTKASKKSKVSTEEVKGKIDLGAIDFASTEEPTVLSSSYSSSFTSILSSDPTASPTAPPTSPPSKHPTAPPTSPPSKRPTAFPTGSPSERPSGSPTTSPSGSPTVSIIVNSAPIATKSSKQTVDNRKEPESPKKAKTQDPN